MSEKTAKLTARLVRQFKWPPGTYRRLKRAGRGKSHKVKAQAYRRMRLTLKHGKRLEFERTIEEWKQ